MPKVTYYMTGAELRAVRFKMGLSQSLLAEQLGINQETVARWEGGRSKRIQRSTILARALRDVHRSMWEPKVEDLLIMYAKTNPEKILEMIEETYAEEDDRQDKPGDIPGEGRSAIGVDSADSGDHASGLHSEREATE